MPILWGVSHRLVIGARQTAGIVTCAGSLQDGDEPAAETSSVWSGFDSCMAVKGVGVKPHKKWAPRGEPSSHGAPEGNVCQKPETGSLVR